MTKNKNGQPRKHGSGKTKGATSFMTICLDDLNKFFDQDSQIVVGRKFLESAHFIESKQEIKKGEPSSISVEVHDYSKEA